MFLFLFGLYLQHYSPLSILPSLEILPNEVLLEVLYYASVSDLYYGWLNLNRRFDALVHSLRIKEFYTEQKHSSCEQRWSCAGENSSDVEALRYFASQLVCLRIDTSLINEINLVDYSHLAILQIPQSNINQLDAIQPNNFPHLKHLSLDKTANFSFEVLCRFKTLHSCELKSLKIDDQYSHLSSSIQSLTLHICFPDELPILLDHFPEMIFFRVFIALSSALDKWNPTLAFVHSNIKSLDIYFFDTDESINEASNDKYCPVSQVLAFISSKKRIRYRLTLVDTFNFDFDQLQRDVLKLDFVYCAFRLNWIHRYRTVPNIDCIRQVPLFNKLKILHINATTTLCGLTWRNTSIRSC